ncbi:hypothetical protein SAMN04244574_02894 [Azotobacter beijerinckii]|uniref:Uncharacterized protein n=1 Tax=Azotobacter beijerinckii TaxID=170623 RepID=A0A1I4EEU2_9GAMM|nr:hypothetical protein SAMN04244571_03089 [Azotobacter beijerinckii]SFL04265.1 hypothetical protein SAMN04244574_02894 [Azotobacter beijerinckii]
MKPMKEKQTMERICRVVPWTGSVGGALDMAIFRMAGLLE